MAYATQYGPDNYQGEFANDAAAWAEIRARKWDSSGDGLGNPIEGQWYANTTDNVPRYYDGSAWQTIAINGPYVKTDGTTPLTANWAVGSFKLTGLVNGAAGSQDSCTVKQMEDAIAAATQGLFWLDDVRALADRTGLPAYARVVDVMTASGNGAFPSQDGVGPLLDASYLVAHTDDTGHVDNGVYTLTQVGDGSNPWILTRVAEMSNNDSAHSRVMTIDQGTNYGELSFRCSNDEGSAVVNTDALIFKEFAKSISHNSTLGLQGGQASPAQYYHLTLTQHTDLTDSGDCTIHHHDGRYFTETELGDTASGTEGASLIGCGDTGAALTDLNGATDVNTALVFLNDQKPRGYQENAGNPNGVVTPNQQGARCFDTTNKITYFAHGTLNTDWRTY